MTEGFAQEPGEGLRGHFTDRHRELAMLGAAEPADMSVDRHVVRVLVDDGVLTLRGEKKSETQDGVCGDSRDGETLRLLMHGETADLIFTDPPCREGAIAFVCMEVSNTPEGTAQNLLSFSAQFRVCPASPLGAVWGRRYLH